MQTTGNVFEEQARAVKARALLGTIDAALTTSGTDPVSEYALRLVAAFGEKEWTAVSRIAGVHFPSIETQAQVLAAMRVRLSTMAKLSGDCAAVGGAL